MYLGAIRFGNARKECLVIFLVFEEKKDFVLKDASVQLYLWPFQLFSKWDYSSSFSVVDFVGFSSAKFEHFWLFASYQKLGHWWMKLHWLFILTGSRIHHREQQRERETNRRYPKVPRRKKSVINFRARNWC